MRKPDFCIWENKGAVQLRSNCAADQCLCFHYINSTIPLLPKSEILSLWLYSPVRLSDLFVSDLVGNPKERFSPDAAHLLNLCTI